MTVDRRALLQALARLAATTPPDELHAANPTLTIAALALRSVGTIRKALAA